MGALFDVVTEATAKKFWDHRREPDHRPEEKPPWVPYTIYDAVSEVRRTLNSTERKELIGELDQEDTKVPPEMAQNLMFDQDMEKEIGTSSLIDGIIDANIVRRLELDREIREEENLRIEAAYAKNQN